VDRARTGWSRKKFVRTARRYRTVQIHAGNQTTTAAARRAEGAPLIHKSQDRHGPDRSEWRCGVAVV
jgi:hypothetical protein